jgi:hypothetical protein
MMRERTMLFKSHEGAVDTQYQAEPLRKRHSTHLSSLYGMLAEILFSVGLILIGFIISLLCGWYKSL